MKISKFIATLLIAFSLLAFSANRASAFSNGDDNNQGNENNQGRNDDGNKGKGDDDDKGKGGDDDKSGGGGTCLPINGQAWFLLVAGLSIGSYVILNKSKQLN